GKAKATTLPAVSTFDVDAAFAGKGTTAAARSNVFTHLNTWRSKCQYNSWTYISWRIVPDQYPIVDPVLKYSLNLHVNLRNRLEKTTQCWSNIGARQTECDVCLQKSDLVAAVKAVAARLYRVKRHSDYQLGNLIGQLDLASGTLFAALELRKNI